MESVDVEEAESVETVAATTKRRPSGHCRVLRFGCGAASKDGKCCHYSGKQKSGKSIEERAFVFGGYLLKNIFDVDTTGNALSSNVDCEYGYYSGKEESGEPAKKRVLAFGCQFLKNMFGVVTGSDALRSFAHQEP